MSKNQRYIRISPPFTLNKYLDNTSNERSSGSFFELKNYIPRDDILRTREGITLFTHTPAATIVIVTYDLTMNISGGSGTITPASGSHTYNDGDVVTITATPSLTYRFSGWTGDVADATASSTTVNMSSNQTVSALFALIANDFSGDANCLSVWKLNILPSNIAEDSKGGNNFAIHSAVGTAYITVDSSNYATSYLSASVSLNNVPTIRSAWMTCTYANQITALPGSVGEDTTFSLCCWIRPVGDPGNEQRAMVSRYHTGQRQWILRKAITHDSFNFVMTDVAISNHQITSTHTWTYGNWYHVLCTFNSASKTATMRVCDSGGSSVFSGSFSLPTGMASWNEDLELGTFGASPSFTFDGNINELCIFNDIVTDAEQDQIIAGTYAP